VYFNAAMFAQIYLWGLWVYLFG